VDPPAFINHINTVIEIARCEALNNKGYQDLEVRFIADGIKIVAHAPGSILSCRPSYYTHLFLSLVSQKIKPYGPLAEPSLG
jgi:hypothetical protein